ncbi:galectin-3-like [Salvelinus fontinalis]|uniref:galectin-3-like n=1 Tax=Salvelinus fontinalis TaxID=8038 RepID=UPI0024854398|nr:galectin-3-like [Salvelinus fontinalis]
MELSDALCGCPSSGSTPQGSNSIWPSQQQPGGPVWPTQPSQQHTQPQSPSCWSEQPSIPCWPGPQPSQPSPAPAQNWPGLQPQPLQPAPAHPCQPCWPGPQYQAQALQPQPAPQSSQSPDPAPAPAPGSSEVLDQSSALNPGSGWPFCPGQSGWPGQNPGLNPGLNRGGSGWPFSPGQDPGGFKPAPQWNSTPTQHLNVPYKLNLQRGLYDKMMLTIMGQIKPNAKQFTVNFLRGNDIAFHLNTRFNEGGKQAVVRNHKVGERWGKEERHTQGGFPFMAGQSFEMKILIMFEEYKVAVNGAQVFEFKHCVREFNQIDRINILHDVILTSVNIDTIP